MTFSWYLDSTTLVVGRLALQYHGRWSVNNPDDTMPKILWIGIMQIPMSSRPGPIEGNRSVHRNMHFSDVCPDPPVHRAGILPCLPIRVVHRHSTPTLQKL